MCVIVFHQQMDKLEFVSEAGKGSFWEVSDRTFFLQSRRLFYHSFFHSAFGL